MVCIFVVSARLQHTPLILARVTKIGLFAVVAGHVHALVRKALVRNLLQTQLQFDQIVLMPQRKADRLIIGL